MDETDLIRRFKTGDRAAFAQIVALYQGSVYAYIRPRLVQTSDAEDLTQEAFLRLYKGRARFRTGHQLRPWLLGIARNLLREHVRRVRRHKKREVAWTELCLEVDAFEPPGEEDDPYQEALAHLPSCLGNLGESARTAIDLRYHAKLGLAAIGEKLRRSEGAIKLLMFRARQALRQCLNGKLNQGSDDRR
jgi:RNA polymerase sigma-70 factor (ECF subfamily)